MVSKAKLLTMLHRLADVATGADGMRLVVCEIVVMRRQVRKEHLRKTRMDIDEYFGVR